VKLEFRERLVDPDLLFLTQDEDFLFATDLTATILLSRAGKRYRCVSRWTLGYGPRVNSSESALRKALRTP
jgi:hypothetical protein